MLNPKRQTLMVQGLGSWGCREQGPGGYRGPYSGAAGGGDAL